MDATPKIKIPKTETRKAAELGITLLVVGLLVAFGVYVIQQINKLTNICYVITGGTINSITTENVSLSLLLGIKNISDIAITLTALNLDIYVNGNYISSVSQSANNLIAPDAMSTLDFLIQFNPNNLINSGNNLLTTALLSGSNITIETKGTASISISGVAVNNINVDDSVTMAQITSGQGSGHGC